jgi:hypothetical protein
MDRSQWPLESLIADVNGSNLRLDSTTGSAMTVDYAHHEVHSGSHYQYLDSHTIIKDASQDHMLVAPDTTKWAHFVIGVLSITSTVQIEFFEGPTYSDPGSVEPVINRNRNFADNNTTELYEDPVLITDGTRLSNIVLGAGRNSDGGAARDSLEIILKQNTAYLIRVTELNVATTIVNLNFDWYEHTNR